MKRLDDQARRLERTAQGPTLESFIATERAASPALDGRSVFGWERDLANPKAQGCKPSPAAMERIKRRDPLAWPSAAASARR